MAGTMEVTWEDVLSSIDNLLMETEIQDNNSDLGFHEAALVLNRLEIAVSVLCEYKLCVIKYCNNPATIFESS